MRQKIVGIRFKPAGRIYHFNAGHLDVKIGTHVIVDTARGMEYGEVVTEPKERDDETIYKPVVRIATQEDLTRVKEQEKKAKGAFEVGQAKINKHGLPMKLVDVEYTFDGSKLIFYFTSDGRVDFRNLVKDLASHFRMRIELRQIGVRDQAKMIGGLGPCGRAMCCVTFLGDFEPVSIKMAKEQNLSLNPSKISGICGRLMCCLRYESDLYEKGQGPACQKKKKED